MDPEPARIREYAEQAVAYVKRALGVTLEYDSDTLPVLDHYLATVRDSLPEARDLVIATSGAYFGEVVRRRLGGRWEAAPGDVENPRAPDERVVLPTGLTFSPAGFVASAIAQGEVEDFDTELDAPARMRPYVQQALARMGNVTVDDYYSLCGRLDTVEHVHEVLVAVAAQMLGGTVDPDVGGEADAESAEPDVPQHVADEPSGGVN